MSRLRYESKRRRERERIAAMRLHFKRHPGNDVVRFCLHHRACESGRLFAMYYDTLDELWKAIDLPGWLLWMADRLGQSSSAWKQAADKLRADQVVFTRWHNETLWTKGLKTSAMCASYMRSRCERPPL